MVRCDRAGIPWMGGWGSKRTPSSATLHWAGWPTVPSSSPATAPTAPRRSAYRLTPTTIHEWQVPTCLLAVLLDEQ